MKFELIVVPHHKQRYPTVGDWVIDYEKNDIKIFVSDLKDWRKTACVAVHELMEVILCMARGITQEQVDKFDMDYEANRHESDTVSEPGDDSKAPYRKEHFFATNIERLLCAELGLDWREYEETIYNL